MPMQYGPYLLLERISVGGMAEVYKAKEYGVEGFERTVAVKRILPHVAEDEEFIAMFKDEAKIAVQLNHGNIAQIYNLGNEQDSFYIALEYINGRDLRAIFQKCQQQGKPMPISQACYVIMKICEGLDYAHNKKDKYQRELNIIHRDVSPPNILVSFEGEVKLIDFGVAKAAGRASRTQAGILKGKFGYMSPEQVRGMPLDRRSDVFSVGVVLFEMLTGTRLFQADTDFATLEKVRAVEVPRPTSLNPDINKPLENIMYKALAREPEQRYQSAIELHDELQAFMFAQGLFYARKDLAGWMRVQYAREIELEKEKDKAQAIAQQREEAEAALPRKRTTMMMPSGGGPPPPPPRRSTGGAPPPPPRGAEAAPPRPKKVKRKTMVMTTARPNLPVPPGAGPPKPKPRGRAAEGDPPTVPIAQALPKPKSMPANPQPKPKSKSTLSYAAASAPPSSDFDWDDDELETRLFEGEGDAAFDPGGPRMPAERESAEVGGAIAASSAEAADQVPRQAVTIVPPGGVQSAPSRSAADDAVARGATVVPGMMQHPPHQQQQQYQQQQQQQQYQQPYPQHQPMGGGGPAMVPGATQAFPSIPQSGVDYDDRPPAKSSTGMYLGIAAVVVVVVVVAAGAGFMIMTGRIGGGGESGSGEVAQTDKPSESGQSDKPSTNAAALTALTVQTTPSDAKVTVDGRAIDGESPFVVSNLEPGKHKLVVSGDAYLPFEREIDVPASGLNFPVPPLQAKEVTLVLDSDPAGASMKLVVDGKAVDMGTAGSQHKVTRDPNGTYEVEASLKGYVTKKEPLRFTGDATQPVRVTLVRDQTIADASTTAEKPEPTPKTTTSKRPKPTTSTPKPTPKPAAKTAILRIGTNPGVPPAKVTVDGRFVGKTPLQEVKVPPGSRKVKFEWTDRPTVTQTVNVGDNESKVVKGG
jgi:eukaryotic-like serine/threonine-protein kinase